MLVVGVIHKRGALGSVAAFIGLVGVVQNRKHRVCDVFPSLGRVLGALLLGVEFLALLGDLLLEILVVLLRLGELGIGVELLGSGVEVGAQGVDFLGELIIVAGRVREVLYVLESLLLGGLLIRANGVTHHGGEVGGDVDSVVRGHKRGRGAGSVAGLIFFGAFLQLRLDGLGHVGPGRVLNAAGVRLIGCGNHRGRWRIREGRLRDDCGGKEGRGNQCEQEHDGSHFTRRNRGRLLMGSVHPHRAREGIGNVRVVFSNCVQFSGLRTGATNHAKPSLTANTSIAQDQL